MKREVFTRIRIELSGVDTTFKKPIEDSIVGFVHKMLGENNKWHDGFSNYNISGLYGGVVKDGYLSFPNGGYFYVSSIDEEFLELLAKNLFHKQGTLDICGMKVKSFTFESNELYSDYDVIRMTSPLLLKVHGDKYLTYKDDSFLEELTEQCKNKLRNADYSEREIGKFQIESFHFEGARECIAKRKNYALPSSMVMLVVKGKPKCRKAIYEMGLGSSTGYCFGTVKVVNNNKDNNNFNF